MTNQQNSKSEIRSLVEQIANCSDARAVALTDVIMEQLGAIPISEWTQSKVAEVIETEITVNLQISEGKQIH